MTAVELQPDSTMTAKSNGATASAFALDPDNKRLASAAALIDDGGGDERQRRQQQAMLANGIEASEGRAARTPFNTPQLTMTSPPAADPSTPSPSAAVVEAPATTIVSSDDDADIDGGNNRRMLHADGGNAGGDQRSLLEFERVEHEVMLMQQRKMEAKSGEEEGSAENEGSLQRAPNADDDAATVPTSTNPFDDDDESAEDERAATVTSVGSHRHAESDEPDNASARDENAGVEARNDAATNGTETSGEHGSNEEAAAHNRERRTPVDVDAEVETRAGGAMSDSGLDNESVECAEKNAEPDAQKFDYRNEQQIEESPLIADHECNSRCDPIEEKLEQPIQSIDADDVVEKPKRDDEKQRISIESEECIVSRGSERGADTDTDRASPQQTEAKKSEGKKEKRQKNGAGPAQRAAPANEKKRTKICSIL